MFCYNNELHLSVWEFEKVLVFLISNPFHKMFKFQAWYDFSTTSWFIRLRYVSAPHRGVLTIHCWSLDQLCSMPKTAKQIELLRPNWAKRVAWPWWAEGFTFVQLCCSMCSQHVLKNWWNDLLQFIVANMQRLTSITVRYFELMLCCCFSKLSLIQFNILRQWNNPISIGYSLKPWPHSCSKKCACVLHWDEGAGVCLWNSSLDPISHIHFLVPS